jgi:CheY-like chemotaxis protein
MAKRREMKRILVIEDEADVLTFASRVLKLEGYHILQAEDGDKGLRLAREKECALVLLDLRLPTIDGWAVLEQLKSGPELSAIPVVVFTASAAASERERALSMGAVDYLVKPLSAADLRASIARALAPLDG